MWLDIGIVALADLGIYCFAVLTGFQTRMLARRSNRRAEDMYDQYAGSPRQQRRYTKEHGETWHDDRTGAHAASGTSAHRYRRGEGYSPG